MTIRQTEKDLVAEFREKKEALEQLEIKTSQAKLQFEDIEARVLDYLESIGAKSTAKYDGIGKITAIKPTVKGNCTEEFKEDLFNYLRDNDMEYHIREVVYPGTLNSIVKDLILEGKEIPKFIGYYFSQKARLYK